uniref:Uncharacterized protein n=1 Tax=Hucho hucho TaxID=62062 RepID=A0A4W5M229_9TELE
MKAHSTISVCLLAGYHIRLTMASLPGKVSSLNYNILGGGVFQIQVLGNPSGVQQFMQALAILMSPVRHRAEFMSHMKPCESQSAAASGPESGNWTLVDEGGEEVNRVCACMCWCVWYFREFDPRSVGRSVVRLLMCVCVHVCFSG